jgi:hypothetical protein
MNIKKGMMINGILKNNIRSADALTHPAPNGMLCFCFNACPNNDVACQRGRGSLRRCPSCAQSDINDLSQLFRICY